MRRYTRHNSCHLYNENTPRDVCTDPNERCNYARLELQPQEQDKETTNEKRTRIKNKNKKKHLHIEMGSLPGIKIKPIFTIHSRTIDVFLRESILRVLRNQWKSPLLTEIQYYHGFFKTICQLFSSTTKTFLKLSPRVIS